MQEPMFVRMLENKICWQRQVWFYTSEDGRCGVTLETAERLVEHAPRLIAMLQPTQQLEVGPFKAEVSTEALLILPVAFSGHEGQRVKVLIAWLAGIQRLLKAVVVRIHEKQPAKSFLASIKNGEVDWEPPDMKSRPLFARVSSP